MKKNNTKTNKRQNSDLAKLPQITPSEPLSIRSKRVYPIRHCANPNCSFGGVFIPHRSNQFYCFEQCRKNFNNDKGKVENNTIFLHAKKLIEIDKKLMKIYQKYVNWNGYCVVMKEILHYEGIDVMLLVQEQKNPQTNGKVKQYFRYGLELHPQNLDYYIIHKI